MDSSNTYVDPWVEYKQISAKLRKRFMRKPNVSEAAREYKRLAAKLKEEDQCPEYAAMCHLAAARCEQQVGNCLAESASLTAAAQTFMQQEEDLADMQSPNFHSNLASAMHCYTHAIRSHVERKQYVLAGRLCAQLAHRLHKLGNCSQAIEFWSRASRYLDSDACIKHSTLTSLARCQVESGCPHDALQTADEIWTHLCKLDASASGADDLLDASSVTIDAKNFMASDAGDSGLTGWRKGALHDVHVTTVLLLVYLKTDPALMTERHGRLYAQFKKNWSLKETIPPPFLTSAFTEAEFLALNNFILAVTPDFLDGNGILGNSERADEALGIVLPIWNVTNCEIALTIVARMIEGIE